MKTLRRLGRLSWVVAAAVLSWTKSVAAHSDVPACKDCATIIPLSGAPSYRVGSGLFQVKEDQVVDLTDRKVLFKFKFISNVIYLYLNGRPMPSDTGARVNLRQLVPNTFSDRKTCTLDVIKATSPRGTKGAAVFRLHCI